ncbi:unnamed protein product, partial [Meganyctiphanes norvegica]
MIEVEYLVHITSFYSCHHDRDSQRTFRAHPKKHPKKLHYPTYQAAYLCLSENTKWPKGPAKYRYVRSSRFRNKKPGIRGLVTRSQGINEHRIKTSFNKSDTRLRTFRFDPFQVFEVEYEACLDLEITVVKGEAITKGSWGADMVDTPDPYVILKVPGCSNSSKRTSHVDNDTNPMYNETFHLFLDPSKLDNFVLNVTLMDANYTLDEILGVDKLPISRLTLGVKQEHIFNFPGGSKVYTELLLQKNKRPDLRFSLALCEEEKDFLQLRRRKVLASLQKILEPGDAPDNEKQVPIMAILGSGGGFRAMTCLSGAVKALQESGILDCATYIAGLSGSSWYISTLYAHDDFPNVLTHKQIQRELRDSVTTNWKWCLTKCASYFKAMYNKSSLGQPVSFTDFFGHLLGDVLLKGKKRKKLTDLQAKVKDGNIPFPLMTGLHAKKNVSAKAFSEWVEFSPYEIGIAKYGTFMKTEHFGCKFLVGKMIKQFDELPLHFLQGVWGSAFTILFKRLVMEGGSKDIVQIMRDAQKEDGITDIMDPGCSTDESDEETDDEEDIEGRDDLEDEQLKDDDSYGEEELKNGNVLTNGRKISTDRKLRRISREERRAISDTSDEEKIRKISSTKKPSFDFPPRKVSQDERRRSFESDPGMSRKSFGNESGSTTDLTADENYRSPLQRKNARKISRNKEGNNSSNNCDLDTTRNSWSQRRKTLRKSRVKKQAGWITSVKQNILKGSTILNSRAGRAGEILNPFRGLSLSNSFPLSPLSAFNDEEVNEDEVDDSTLLKNSRYQPLDNSAKKLFIVDSGLAFNSPFPLLLRPQRAVDIYLSFDFSQRPNDSAPPFKELLLAEKWAAQNKVAFPPIEKEVQQYLNERPQELYVFKHPTDPHCPVILHFVLVNNLFREYKAPGVERETEEEREFADFPIFDDESQPYNSMNFYYNELQYNRLIKLVEFNTLICLETIKEEIAKIVHKKKQHIYKNLTFTDVAKLVKTVNSYLGKDECDENKLKLKIGADQQRLLKEYSNRQLSEQTSISPSTPHSGIARTESYHSAEESEGGSEYDDAVEDFEKLEIKEQLPT